MFSKANLATLPDNSLPLKSSLPRAHKRSLKSSYWPKCEKKSMSTPSLSEAHSMPLKHCTSRPYRKDASQPTQGTPVSQSFQAAFNINLSFAQTNSSCTFLISTWAYAIAVATLLDCRKEKSKTDRVPLASDRVVAVGRICAWLCADPPLVRFRTFRWTVWYTSGSLSCEIFIRLTQTQLRCPFGISVRIYLEPSCLGVEPWRFG